MNKKSIIAISVLAIMLIVGIFYAIQEQEQVAEQPIIEENDENSEQLPDEAISEQEENNEDKEDIEDVVLERGKPAPDFTLQTLSGEKASLSDYKGKIVLINFWATWCTYCDEEMPDLEKLYNDNKNDDFVVLAVDVGEEESLVRDYIEEGGYTFPVLLDSNMKVSRNNYYVSAFPTSYFIDKNGNLIGAVPGMMTYPQMTQILEQIRNGEL
ncbi:TlpA family protein disulfide reductase [Senegalia massiliensis]|uniref:TlpA family protein disulfide reductase n=1 Tax=Senegalia massiliensis TaxID=1720316 RepID=A0A845QXN0_9CLOT|nr:TlpA disulfide reductase family protein [Senegalia massiliensis]NBI06256.1 TlpA family protein disulfide reductase [Senegalia massiliensis]